MTTTINQNITSSTNISGISKIEYNDGNASETIRPLYVADNKFSTTN